MRITIEFDAKEHLGGSLPTREAMLGKTTAELTSLLNKLKRMDKEYVSLRYFELVSVRVEDGSEVTRG